MAPQGNRCFGLGESFRQSAPVYRFVLGGEGRSRRLQHRRIHALRTATGRLAADIQAMLGGQRAVDLRTKAA
jgi:hypothetical protein